jgi:hypothetical protein
MKDYKVIIDGYLIGIVSLTPEEVKLLTTDQDIKIKEV